jgi:hypothetical protein
MTWRNRKDWKAPSSSVYTRCRLQSWLLQDLAGLHHRCAVVDCTGSQHHGCCVPMCGRTRGNISGGYKRCPCSRGPSRTANRCRRRGAACGTRNFPACPASQVLPCTSGSAPTSSHKSGSGGFASVHGILRSNGCTYIKVGRGRQTPLPMLQYSSRCSLCDDINGQAAHKIVCCF